MGGNKSIRRIPWQKRNLVYDSRKGGPLPFVQGSSWAVELGVSEAVISQIRTGRIYRFPPGVRAAQVPSPRMRLRYIEAKKMLASGETIKGTAFILDLPHHVVEKLFQGRIGADLSWPNGALGGFAEAYGQEALNRRRGKKKAQRKERE